jgi:hypothetical protein
VIQHHFLNIPIAQGKSVVEPNAIANNLARKAMTGIHEQEVASLVVYHRDYDRLGFG